MPYQIFICRLQLLDEHFLLFGSLLQFVHRLVDALIFVVEGADFIYLRLIIFGLPTVFIQIRLIAPEEGQFVFLAGLKMHELRRLRFNCAVLSSATQLRPLGNPTRKATKYFHEAEIARLEGNVAWLDKAVRTIREYWSWKKRNSKNAQKTGVDNL